MANGFVASTFYRAIETSLDGVKWFCPVNTLFFYDGVTGYGMSSTSSFAVMCGTNSVVGPIIGRSTDGFNWSYATIVPTLSSFVTLRSISITDTYGVCVGYDGGGDLVVLRSLDNGLTWIDATPSGYFGAFDVWADSTRAIIGLNQNPSVAPVAIVSTDQGATWTSHTSIGTAHDTTILGAGGNSSQYFLVGYGDPTQSTALIETSPTGSTWTQRTPTESTNTNFIGVYATDSLAVAVGTDATTRVLNTSSNNGVTWSDAASLPTIPISQPTPPINYNYVLNTVTKNDALWAAGGNLTVDIEGGQPGIILTSSDGSNWTYNGAGDNGKITGIAPFNPIPPQPVGPYTAIVYDASCHLFLSQDKGTNWVESHQNSESIGDGWNDLQMAVNDGDYKTMLSFDGSYLASSESRLALTTDYGFTGTWDLINPGSTVGQSGVISTAANTIVYTGGSGHIYRSTNGGSSFSLTSAPGRSYFTFAMSANASVIYAASFGNKINKSTDQGATWTDLVGSATIADHTSFCSWIRMRCSQDGSVIILGIGAAFDPVGNPDGDDEVWVSTNSGVTWTKVLLAAGASGVVDVGVSANGSSMIFVGDVDIANNTYISTNTGSTWTQLSLSSGGFITEIDALGFDTTPYSGATTIVISDPTGSGASATPIIVAGRVTGANILSGGSDYTNPTAVLVDPGGGSGQTLAVVINGAFPVCCNVSPDGQAFLIGYGNGAVDLSFDQGATWTLSQSTSIFGFVGSYIVPGNPFPSTSRTYETILG
jgi:hypothetical protein